MLLSMKTKSLLETNAYLRDPDQRERLLKLSVISSTAVEGVSVAAFDALGVEKPSRKRSLATARPAAASGK